MRTLEDERLAGEAVLGGGGEMGRMRTHKTDRKGYVAYRTSLGEVR